MGYIKGLVEVHSLMIVMNQARAKQVYGEFWALDATGRRFYFFKKSKESATPLCEDGTLPLVGPLRCLTKPDFTFFISLKEKDSDLEVCYGYFSSGNDVLGGLSDKSLRLVCTGVGFSYAVLHITVFSRAAQASINVALVIKKDKIRGHVPAIHGKLVARYTQEEYDDEFYRKYFPTVLLNVPKDEPKVLPEAGDREEGQEMYKRFKIPLPRSVVAVDQEGSLFIQTDLGINFEGSPSEALKVNRVWSFAATRFDSESTQCFDLDHGYGQIEVKVRWVSDVWDIPFDGRA